MGEVKNIMLMLVVVVVLVVVKLAKTILRRDIMLMCKIMMVRMNPELTTTSEPRTPLQLAVDQVASLSLGMWHNLSIPFGPGCFSIYSVLAKFVHLRKSLGKSKY